MARTTWRLEYVDHNKSIDVGTDVESSWVGYAVIRAPKGQTAAQFVPQGNRARIEAMFGYASADWPDLYEVIDFNQNYGVYISAPTINSADYPSYYGGAYLTKYGLLNMYRVTDPKDPNFEVGIKPTMEPVVLPNANASSVQLVTLNKPGEQAKLEIKGVDPKVFQKLKYIDFNWTGKNVPFRYTLDKTNGWILPDGTSVADPAGQRIVCGTFALNSETGKYDFILGGAKTDQLGNAFTSLMNTAEDERAFGIPFIDFTSSTYKSNPAYNYSRYIDFTDDDWASGTIATNILSAIVNGGSVYPDNSGTKLTYNSIFKSFNLVLDIADDVYSYHIQPSATANKTTISVKDIVYDKYNYSKRYFYTSQAYTQLPTPATDAEKFGKLLTDDGYMVLAKNSTANGILKLYEYKLDEDEDDEGNIITAGAWTDVTAEYATESVLAFDTIDNAVDRDIHHKIYRIVDTSLVEMTTDATDEDLVLTENRLFNSYYCKASEEDTEGEIHTSGAFVGSLDEFGVDENGADNYWEDLIPPGEAVVFAEPHIVRTFEDDLDDRGIYTGYRIEPDATTVVFGQRYVDSVVAQNIKEGKTGGDCTTASESVKRKFARILKEGFIEATQPKYEDCSIFMDFSGLDALKTYFGAIRTAHNTATIISPKLITSIDNCKAISVTSRYRGTAQFCQELYYKDRNLRKKYYATPIGATGAMLMRIMENFYGGRAPMWLNEGGVGGQITGFLSRQPISHRWDFSDEDTKIFDKKGINPIKMDDRHGVMILSHRTTEQNAGDWGYLGHSMSFDLCKREIRDNVMIPQIGKKISPHWISKRQQQVDIILAKRTGGDDPIWAYAHSDIASVNNDYTRAQKIFNIPVEVRVYPISEVVRLSFTNLAQTPVLSD